MGIFKPDDWDRTNEAINRYNNLVDVSADKAQNFTKKMSQLNPQFGNYLKNLNGAKTSMGSYTASLVGATIKTVALQAASMALQAVLTWGIGAAISLIVTGFQKLWKFIPTVEHLKERFEETAQELEDICSEQQSLNDELKTMQERIAELESKGVLSFTDEAELNRLRQECAELKRKNDLLDEQRKIKSEEQIENFKDTFNSNYQWTTVRSRYETEIEGVKGGAQVAASISKQDYIDEQFRYLQELETKLKTATDKERKNVEKEIRETKKYLSDEITTSQGYLDALLEAGYIYGSDETADKYIDWIYKFQDKYMVAVGNTADLFNSIINRDKFSEAREAIEELGTVTADSLQTLYDKGGNVKELIDHLLSLGTIDWQSLLGDDFDKVAGDDGIVSTAEALDWMNESGDNSAKVMFLLANEITKVENAAEKSEASITSLANSLNELETISDKFSKLGSAISELKKDGYVSLKTINEIAEAFKGTEGLDDYISKIATASNTSQLQSAIEGLINSYLNQETVLKNLNGANQQVLATQLQRLGVTNAEEVINNRIKSQLVDLKSKTLDYANVTLYQANALYVLAQQSNLASSELIKYSKVAEKAAEIDRLIEESKSKNAKDPRGYSAQIGRLRNEIQSILNDTNIDLLNIGNTTSSIKINMPKIESLGGSSSSSKSGKTEAEKYFDKQKYLLETNQITQEEYLKRINKEYQNFYKKQGDDLENFYKYSQEVYDGFKDMYKDDLDAQKDAWEDKKKAVSDYYDNLRKQIEDANDKEDYEKEQSEKRKEIFDLDMKIAELMKDGSEKAKARIAQLEEERLKAEEALLDFETDKAREDELKRLEKEQEAEEKKIQDKIDGIQGQLDQLDKDTVSVRNAIIAYAKQKGVTLDFAYASGTRSSVGGYGRINERGLEAAFSPDGRGNYVNLAQGSYVFSAQATDFLWKLATEHSLPQAMYNSIAKSIKTQNNNAPSVNVAQPIQITMGDVIIQGNADKQTVADIKKQQENTVRMVLQKIKELQK